MKSFIFFALFFIAAITCNAQSQQCAGIAKSTGKQCKNKTTATYCHVHDGKATTTTKATSSASPATVCGAMTQKGTACQRKVAGGGRCFSHK